MEKGVKSILIIFLSIIGIVVLLSFYRYIYLEDVIFLTEGFSLESE